MFMNTKLPPTNPILPLALPLFRLMPDSFRLQRKRDRPWEVVWFLEREQALAGYHGNPSPSSSPPYAVAVEQDPDWVW